MKRGEFVNDVASGIFLVVFVIFIPRQEGKGDYVRRRTESILGSVLGR